MSKTFKGTSLLKGTRISLYTTFNKAAMSTRLLDLNSMRGEVHRFEGTVDRIGTAQKATGVIETICIRDIVHCRTNQKITPDHWWFRMRQVWMDARLMPGDRVVFVAKVQRCSKGRSAPGSNTQSERRQVTGFGSSVISVVIKQAFAATARARSESFLPHGCPKRREYGMRRATSQVTGT